MKANRIILLTIAMVFVFSIDTFAQRGAMRGQGQACNLPELTTDQQEKINELRINNMARANQHRASMNELRARKQALSIAEKPNMHEINSVIDQMEKQRAEHLKANAAHRQSIREILTPEQRIVFDNRPMQQRRGQGYGQNFGQQRQENMRGQRQGRMNRNR